MAPDDEIAHRLKSVREALGLTQSALSIKIDIPLPTIKRLEGGGFTPSGNTLLRYRDVGINPGWLLSGIGPMRIDAALARGDATPAQFAETELFALVIDAIQRAYKEAGAGISGLDLGRLSAEKYNEIISEAPDPEDWRGAVRMMAAQLRKDISATAADTTNRKREAS